MQVRVVEAARHRKHALSIHPKANTQPILLHKLTASLRLSVMMLKQPTLCHPAHAASKTHALSIHPKANTRTMLLHKLTASLGLSVMMLKQPTLWPYRPMFLA